jgi:hypothetical protein
MVLRSFEHKQFGMEFAKLRGGATSEAPNIRCQSPVAGDKLVDGGNASPITGVVVQKFASQLPRLIQANF